MCVKQNNGTYFWTDQVYTLSSYTTFYFAQTFTTRICSVTTLHTVQQWFIFQHLIVKYPPKPLNGTLKGFIDASRLLLYFYNSQWLSIKHQIDSVLKVKSISCILLHKIQNGRTEDKFYFNVSFKNNTYFEVN